MRRAFILDSNWKSARRDSAYRDQFILSDAELAAELVRMTQKEAARLLGMKNIYSYQRLESGKTANPELLTLVRIKQVFPEIDLDDVVG